MVVGRFAPTPSGRMHLGNAFSALLAWLSCRSQNGRMILRIEDLDTARAKPTYTAGVLEDLAWLGLPWDEGPHYQSKRTVFYEETLQKLKAMGLIYPCFCTRAQLHGQGAPATPPLNENEALAPHGTGGAYLYSGHCATLDAARQKQLAATRPAAMRVRVPSLSVTIQDRLQGEYTENLKTQCGDFVLRRSDGVFAYQLAVSADDGSMGVTEVVRGRDLLGSAPRQSWLMQTLGYTPPGYLHVPLLLAPDGRRLSKREADLGLDAMRARGQTPESLLGLLAHWAGLLEAPRPISAEALVPLFSPKRLRRADITIAGEALATMLA